MRENDPFFLVEDHVNESLNDIRHSEIFESDDYLEHFSFFKSKSKYKGGFKKGKNTKEYNHDYYIHNKDKWKKDGMTEDELKELGFTDEEIAEMGFERNSEGVLIVPTSWVENFLKNGANAALNFINNLGNQLISLFKKDDDDSPFSFDIHVEPKEPEKTDGYEDPKTLDDPQRIENYEYTIEDQSGRGEETITTNFDHISWLEGTKLKDGPSSVKEDCAAVNPHYGEDGGYGINCAWCTTTYDLRRRGYDVQAPKVDHGMTIAEETQLYKDTTITDWTVSKNANELFDQIAKEGNGARGRLSVLWYGDGGHSMAWEVVNNTPYIIDCQTNTIYDETDFSYLSHSIDWTVNDSYGPEVAVTAGGCKWLRTDNRELNVTGTINEDREDPTAPVSEDETLDNWTFNTKDGVWHYSPGSNNTRDISDMFVSYPTDDRSNKLWKDISTKLKRGRLKSKKKSHAKRET